MAKEAWGKGFLLADKVSATSKTFFVWIKEVLAMSLHRKKKLLARIKGIQRHLEHSYSRSLAKLEIKLHKDLDIILSREDISGFKKLGLTRSNMVILIQASSMGEPWPEEESIELKFYQKR